MIKLLYVVMLKVAIMFEIAMAGTPKLVLDHRKTGPMQGFTCDLTAI